MTRKAFYVPRDLNKDLRDLLEELVESAQRTDEGVVDLNEALSAMGDDDDDGGGPSKVGFASTSSQGETTSIPPGKKGSILVVNPTSDTTFKDSTGNLKLEGDAVSTSSTDTLVVISDGQQWLEMARSGGGMSRNLGCPVVINPDSTNCTPVLTVKPGASSTGDFIILGTSTSDYWMKFYNTITGLNCDVRVGGSASVSDRFGVIDDDKGSTVFRVMGRPLVPATWFNVLADENFLANTDLGVTGRLRFAAQDVALVANAAPLTLPTSTIVRITSDASYDIDGIGADNLASAQDEMSKITLINANSAFDLHLQNEDTGQTAADRIITGTGSPDTIVPNTTREIYYDDTSARWRVIQPGIKTFGGYLEVTASVTLTSETVVKIIVAPAAPSIALTYAAAVTDGGRNHDTNETTTWATLNGVTDEMHNTTVGIHCYMAVVAPFNKMQWSITNNPAGSFYFPWEMLTSGTAGWSGGNVTDDQTDTGVPFQQSGVITFGNTTNHTATLNFQNGGSRGPYIWYRTRISTPFAPLPLVDQILVNSLLDQITITLPAASSRAGGSAITIKDGTGQLSVGSIVTIAAAGADTIFTDFADTSYIMQNPGESIELFSDGVSEWAVH